MDRTRWHRCLGVAWLVVSAAPALVLLLAGPASAAATASASPTTNVTDGTVISVTVDGSEGYDGAGLLVVTQCGNATTDGTPLSETTAGDCFGAEAFAQLGVVLGPVDGTDYPFDYPWTSSGIGANDATCISGGIIDCLINISLLDNITDQNILQTILIPVYPPTYEPPPVITPGVADVAEGNTGTAIANVPVTLSGPVGFEVTVEWSTADWTAVAPDDYVAGSGTVTFAPGETAKTVPVTVHGDHLFEHDEYLGVVFSNPTNATLGGFMNLGLVAINDDDPQPTVTPGGFVASPEGDTGSTIWNLPLTLSAPAGAPVSVDYSSFDVPTNPQVAHPGSDYVATSGTITFAPGETSKNIPIEVLGDTADEPPLLYGEWGLVQFSNPVNTTVTGGLFGLGLFIIIDDDL